MIKERIEKRIVAAGEPSRPPSLARWLRKDSTAKTAPTQSEVLLRIMSPTMEQTRATNPATSGSSSSTRLTSGL